MYTIVVAEDDSYLRDAYVTILQAAKYTVVGVSNGKQALESIKTASPDVILLDMLMPVMSGLEFLDEVVQKNLFPTANIVAFTNLSDRDTLYKLKAYGVETYLLKSSVLPMDLINTVESILKKKAES